MNKQNFTSEENKIQESVNNWAKEIEEYLPSNMDESAKEYGAIQRKRGVKSGISLLKLLLIYATSKMSIRMMSLCANALNISEISDTAWHKRITKSVQWLIYLFNGVLSKVTTIDNPVPAESKNVYLIDGSCFRQEGKAQMIYRVHMNYCLNKGLMQEVKVTDCHSAESLSLYNIEANAIYTNLI